MTLGRPGALLAARYRLDRLMGSAGSAERWQAYDERLARPVTAQLSLAAGDAAYEESVQAALERLAGLNHPGVAAVYDVGITDELGEGVAGLEGVGDAAGRVAGVVGGMPATSAVPAASAVSYAISEWTTGRTLGQIIETGAQPWPRVADWGRQISGALAALHSLGIVHGALGPNSVAIHDDRQVKILDPGLGPVGGEDEAESAGAAGDVYALGLLLWKAGLGVGDGDEAPEPEVEGLLAAGAPTGLASLMAEMLDADPARRPAADAARRRFVPFAATERVGDTLPEMSATTTQGSLGRRASGTGETHAVVPTPEVGLARPTAVTQRVGPASGAAASAAAARLAAERERRRRRGMLIGLALLLAAVGTGVGLLIANLHSPNAGNPQVGDTAVPSVSPGTVTLPSASASPSPSQASTSAAPPSSHAPSRSPSATAGSPSASASPSSSASSTPTDSGSASATSSSSRAPSDPATSKSPHPSPSKQ